MPFVTRYHEHKPDQLFKLRKELLNHSHVLKYAAEMKMTLKDVVDQTMEAWRDGTIEPVHDSRGHIVGFR